MEINETADVGMDVLRDTIVPSGSKTVLRSRFLKRWYETSITRVLVDEIGNLACRIRWALEIRSWGLRGYTGQRPTVLAEPLMSQCRTCRDAYILDMQHISNNLPSLTIVDSFLLTRAWRAGLQSALRTDTKKNQRKSCSLCSPMGSDSMLPQAVQQPTKHDL